MTNREEFRQKLEAAHEFPCPYTFKLFGPNDDTLEAAARRIIEAQLPGTTAESSSRASSKANHQCLTLVLVVPSSTAVMDLYAEFHTIDGLKMLM